MNIEDTRESIRDGRVSASAALELVETEISVQETLELLVFRGDLIQLSDNDNYALNDAKSSYERAHLLDPASPLPIEALAYFHWAVLDEEAQAAVLFRQALKLGAGPECARMLSEIEGNSDDA